MERQRQIKISSPAVKQQPEKEIYKCALLQPKLKKPVPQIQLPKPLEGWENSFKRRLDDLNAIVAQNTKEFREPQCKRQRTKRVVISTADLVKTN